MLGAEAFTIENGLLTPSFKPQRCEVLARYGTALDALYQSVRPRSEERAPASHSALLLSAD